ncbi:mandelate racemase/muconate lactonizing enzyme family protein [Stenotrophomonas sp. S41]|uniref:mandelate racemase/muconate lactonizing enzyme family protein n=1 Tax=Stenotrophomonas sp. S41 TaxID=2767464 RepID=UPI00190D698D|nr:mandelate racemase/muconate lactonizing enzyme family protein [Stenotrophomonas sp. S41]MBK0011008.1 mandelate racemase/muconate lactonizing enzyme family protein [Stenotrophomonas sp. S41]
MSAVTRVETFILTVPRSTPYLGPLGIGERVNERGYLVRRGNGTLYPTVDRSVLVRVTSADGAVGWGETYGICAPRATCEIINDLLAPELLGREPEDVEAIWDDLYGLMRVRGCGSGFHTDAVAALDIALWDLRARAADQPLWSLLGERRHERIAGYVSGLPAATLEEKVAMARTFQQQGHTAFKVHAVVSHDGIAEEMAALRQALGADAQLMVDLHWKFDLEGALQLAHQLQPVGLTFIEAPLKPEDVPGLVALGQQSPIPVAAGEEWPTDYVARPRVEGGSLAYVQPEMGHTGITQFLRIARLAAAHGVQVAPHATIGGGIFMAASLHASAVVEGLWRHEWQHSIFSRSVQMLDTDMAYTQDGYQLPSGPGLGAVPNTTFWQHAEAVA